VPVFADAGVVDQDVDAAELAQGRRGQRRGDLRIADRAGDEDAAPAERLDAVGEELLVLGEGEQRLPATLDVEGQRTVDQRDDRPRTDSRIAYS